MTDIKFKDMQPQDPDDQALALRAITALEQASIALDVVDSMLFASRLQTTPPWLIRTRRKLRTLKHEEMEELAHMDRINNR